MKKRLFIITLSVFGQLTFAQQKSIAITIDDVPNTIKYQKDNFNPLLLQKLDSLEVLFTIFINEDKIYKTKFLDKNNKVLEQWIKDERAIIGNHTYSHPRYSEVGFANFIKDIEQGEKLTKQYASKYNKEVKYFRFPFNDMGKDSIQHMQIREYLKSKNYTIAPFTIESSDWMFNTVYQHYLDTGESEKAKVIGEQYVEKTLELVAFYETMANTIYNRPIKQIYLCHDNAINTDYLVEIISRLKKEDYNIISFEESLTDSIYNQEDTYYKKWGVSWIYRWMDTQEERVKWMKQEPNLSEIEKRYNEIQNNKN
ncbi:polysaccharide deacetylase family protein [Flavobacterium sp. J27]|uniref:polysaccharide deacetylase family protein n=1 Tax=Flavobacterium sp. J27 TaxID=2060419 RepID=UPI0010323CD5|nr:polysaccharide deacetylase family protein [Flavobacterium sp. J27]